ncbi:PAS domain S-box protein, partial [bacterium]|nr:PAS domain S-box protein [bacterium]
MFESGEPLFVEGESQFPSGPRWLETWLVPLKGGSGEVASVQGISRDITERKSVARELQESEAKYRTLFDQASDGIMLMAVDGSSRMFNESFARMHGYGSPAEMERLRLEDIDTPETAQLAPERLRRMLAGETLRFEVEHRRKDGQTIALQVSCSVIRIGERPFFLGFHQDITEH